jgi:hypothetical protein
MYVYSSHILIPVIKVDSEQDHSNSVLKDIQVNYLTIFPSFNPNVEKVLFACNIGYLHEIFHNPNHHHQLLEMGFISPIHMFNELFHFLFEIRPSICHGVCLDIKNRLVHARSNSIPIVGIQVHYFTVPHIVILHLMVAIAMLISTHLFISYRFELAIKCSSATTRARPSTTSRALSSHTKKCTGPSCSVLWIFLTACGLITLLSF